MADLTVENGTLYLDGAYCQTIGFNYYSALQKHWSPNANDVGHRFAEDFVVLGNQAGGKNIKIIKVMITPFDAAGTGGHTTIVGSTAGTSNAAYFTDATSGVDALFTAAIANGISIIVNFNWNYKCYPDMFTESYDAWNNPSSQTSIYCKAFLTEFVTRYTTGARADLTNAIAGWGIWTETELNLYKDSNAASIQASINTVGYSRVASEFRSILDSLDSRGRVMMGLTTALTFGQVLSQRVPLIRALEGKSEIYRLFDVVDSHYYSGIKAGGVNGTLDTVSPSTKWQTVRGKYTATDSIKEYINSMMLFARSINKPLIFSEFGVSEFDNAISKRDLISKAVTYTASGAVTDITCADMTGVAVGQFVHGTSGTFTNGSTLNPATIMTVSAGGFTILPSFSTGTTGQTVTIYTDPDNTNTQFQTIIDEIKSSGLQLALCWNWNEPELVPSQSVWSVQTVADNRAFHSKRYKQLDSIVAANSLPTVMQNTLKPKIPAKFASLKYKKPHGLITTKNGLGTAMTTASNEFTTSFWLRQNNANDQYTTANFITIMEFKVASAGAGFIIAINPTGICTNPLSGVAASVSSQSPYIELKRSDATATLITTSGKSAPASTGIWTHFTFVLRKRTGSNYDGAVGTGGVTTLTSSPTVTGTFSTNSLNTVVTTFTTQLGAVGTIAAGMTLYTGAGVLIGTVATVDSATQITLTANANVSLTNAQYRYKDNFYTLYVYRDGLLVDAAGQSGFLVNDVFGYAANATISLFAGSSGLLSTGSGKSIPMDLADVSLYNRALDQSEVYLAYVGQHPTDYVAHWNLDKVVGGVFPDSSLNGFDLTDNSSGALLVDNSVITRTARV